MRVANLIDALKKVEDKTFQVSVELETTHWPIRPVVSAELNHKTKTVVLRIKSPLELYSESVKKSPTV